MCRKGGEEAIKCHAAQEGRSSHDEAGHIVRCISNAWPSVFHPVRVLVLGASVALPHSIRRVFPTLALCCTPSRRNIPPPDEKCFLPLAHPGGVISVLATYRNRKRGRCPAQITARRIGGVMSKSVSLLTLRGGGHRREATRNGDSRSPAFFHADISQLAIQPCTHVDPLHGISTFASLPCAVVSACGCEVSQACTQR